jgi:tRNA A-37 threonylcarbamoyl transferase component Bud32
VSRDELEKAAAALARGETPPGATLLKRSPVRAVARIGDVFLKVFLRPSRRAAREAASLQRAGRLGLPVPELLGAGGDWVATRFLEGRPAERADLPAILALAARMHAARMLHGDFHLGNLLVANGTVVLTDLQRTRLLPWLPRWLARRELGYLAFSLGEPLPAELESTRRWYALRAQRHWRSRTRRCVVESGGFTRFEADGARGFRRRDADAARLRAAIAGVEGAELLKRGDAGRLVRSGGWIVKEHARESRARRAWIAAQGLEARGIRTGRALAWAGRWLVMEDAGPTVQDWVEREFARAGTAEREGFALAMAELLAALHRRGIYHADLKANNVAWTPGAEPRLLDYARVSFGRRVPLRRRIKNLAQLNAALPDLVPSPLRERAFARYLERAPRVPSADELRRRVVAESLSRAHRWTGC